MNIISTKTYQGKNKTDLPKIEDEHPKLTNNQKKYTKP